MFNLYFIRATLMPLFLALLEREGGPRKRWEGYLCFFIHTCCGYNGEVVTFSPIYPTSLLLILRSCRYGTSFVRSDKGCKTLFFCGHNSSFSEYTCSPPPTADYEAIRLYYLSAYTLNKIYTADADDCERLCLLVKLFRLRLLFPQRVGSYKHKYFT